MEDLGKNREETLREPQLLGQGPDSCGVALDERRRVERALFERVKELDCLYGITKLAQNIDMPLGDLATRIADLVRASWQYPEHACARISLDGKDYATGNYRRTEWRQSSPIAIQGALAGEVEVCYLRQYPEIGEGPFLHEERNLLDAVANLIGRIATQRRVESRMRALSRKLIMVQENERKRIARELHDHLSQDLCMAKASLERIWSGIPLGETYRPLAEEVADRLDTAIASVRDLAYALLPVGLMELGLVNTILRHCEEFSQHNGIEVEFFADGMENVKLDFETQINIYRLVQESLNNTRKHAAASRVVIRLLASYPDLLLRIEDDGRGACMEQCLLKAGQERRMGLWSMRERAQLLGGRIVFQSKPGAGMCIRVKIPIERTGREGQAYLDH